MAAPTSVYDHLGNEYKSKAEMCRSYGINVTTYDGRIERGYTVAQALLGKTHQ